nr:hypothetical protein [Tanacetum cinerariifolium]
MFEKDMYDSWKSGMELYMMNRQHGRMILESVENGPLIWPTIEENRVTRLRKYTEVSPTDAIQVDYDVKVTNIILQGLPPKERECKLYDEFDKFTYKKGETLLNFYLRFSLLLNDMNIYKVKLEQFQVNTKFLNTLPPEWSKFVTDVKLDFEKRFVPQTELSAEQAFWSQNSMNSSEPSASCTPTKVEVPKELPTVSMVNTSLKKLKTHLAGFDMVVKERTMATTITEGTWGFEHTKSCFRDEIILFVKALKDIFNKFDQYLIDELTEV